MHRERKYSNIYKLKIVPYFISLFDVVIPFIKIYVKQKRFLRTPMCIVNLGPINHESARERELFDRRYASFLW